MSNNGQLAELGDLLHRSTETIQPQPDAEYSELTVRLWGKGVVERRRVTGAAVLSRRFVAHAGDFIISRIDARNGASGLVPQSLDGALVTNDFPLFKIDKQKLDPRFFEWFTRTRDFVDLCKRASEGTTNRVRLSEERFLALEIPLPSLVEQQRLVAQVEELADQISEAKTLRHQAVDEGEALLIAMAHRADVDGEAKQTMGWRLKPLCDVIRLVDDAHKVVADRSYPNLGIFSFGRGLFHKPAIDGVATSAKSFRRVKAGQFIYSRLFAFEGAYGMVTPEFDGAFVSQEYPTFDCNPKYIRAEFLAAYFKRRTFGKSLRKAAKA